MMRDTCRPKGGGADVCDLFLLGVRLGFSQFHNSHDCQSN